MLTIWGARQHFCDRLTRRSFLALGAFGAGLSLADLLRARAAGANSVPARAKSALMIYLPGGPSHLDTYDMKPDAPAEFRGEFKPIRTSVAGVDVCEFFPRQARMWDKLAVVRSVVAVEEHSDSEIMTGYSEAANRQAHHPSLGAVVSKVRGEARADVPAFVSLRGLSVGLEPGYLGVSHRAFVPSGPGYNNLRLAQGVTEARVQERKDLLTSFDTLRRDLDATGTVAGLDAFQAKAIDMVASGAVRKALDLGREDLRTRERYEGFEPFLTARRLLEAGVSCVTLSFGAWDTHSSNFKALKKQLPKLDRSLATLIDDLHDRGLDKRVLLVVGGDFGRTPRISHVASSGGGVASGAAGVVQPGRDHWPHAMSFLFSGGGINEGQVIGATDRRGEHPADRRVGVGDFMATLYHHLGIDAERSSVRDPGGRPVPLLQQGGTPIRELMVDA